jgi:hypothetical protein
MRTRTIPTLATAGLLAMLALPGAAVAAGTPPLPPGQVRLAAGRDYMLIAEGDVRAGAPGSVTLTDPGGSVVASATSAPDTLDGTEFRARESAVYTIHVASGSGGVAPDCRGDASTLCHVAIHHTKQGGFQAGFDSDWYKVHLLAGRAYGIAFTVDGAAVVGVRDDRGRSLASEDAHPGSQTLTFMPRVSGDYFIEVGVPDDSGDLASAYTLALR